MSTTQRQTTTHTTARWSYDYRCIVVEQTEPWMRADWHAAAA